MSINVLSFTTLYPNAEQPRHGIFIEQRLRHLVETGGVTLKVVAPVPWFPVPVGQYGKYAKVLKTEQRYGIDSYHPRYLVIPKVGMYITPLFLALAGLRKIKTLMRSGYVPDVIDAHYYYPDGVAAALIGKWLNIPVIITARGSDINVLPKYTLPKRMIQWAAKKAAANITVSNALKEEMHKLGVPKEDITVLRNGVDLEAFKVLPEVRKKARGGKRLISVGNLIELKGHHLVIEAIKDIPDIELTIVGEGAMKKQLESLALDLGVADRVCFAGYKTHEELSILYNESDALILASSREGMPNVLLEAMACGTPVIATNVGGAVEVVKENAGGQLIDDRTAPAIRVAAQTLFLNYPETTETRRYAEKFSWDNTTKGLIKRLKIIT